MTRPYRPSNGTEGMAFTDAFCDRCERDARYRKTDNPEYACKILSATLIHDIGDKDYPKEWIQDDDGSNPRCTAFQAEAKPKTKAGTPVGRPDDGKTGSLF